MASVLLFVQEPFSQFHPFRFRLGSHDYVCAEQYMHEQKARLSGDVDKAARIPTAPHEHKLIATEPARWQGQSLLGQILMAVRTELAK